MESALDIIKAVTVCTASIVGIITLIKGYREYTRTTKLKRIELYNEYRQKMVSDENVKAILNLLENSSKELRELPRIKRYKFIGYFEDIALIMNSGFIKPEIAHYMFAYYAKMCWHNEDFWHDINRESHYWRVFKEFVLKMEDLEKKNMTIPSNKELKYEL